MRARQGPATEITLEVLSKWKQYEKDTPETAETFSRRLVEYERGFCGDLAYAEVFAKTLKIYRSSPVYCLATDRVVQMDQYLTDYCSVQNELWLRRCKQFQREVAPAILDDAEKLQLFGAYENRNKFWEDNGLANYFGLVRKCSDVQSALPQNSTCVVVARYEYEEGEEQHVAYAVEITRIQGQPRGTRGYARLL